MKISESVKNKIDRFAEGYVFTYNDFDVAVKSISALKSALYRLVESGKIVRLSKGRFYKPKKGITGNLKPDEYEVVKDLLKENKKIIGYITGLGVFNRFGLTTQMSNIIQIGSNIDKKQIKRGKYIIKFIRQRNVIKSNYIYLLQLLDCLRFIKNIPDADINSSFERIIILIKELPEKDLKTLGELATNYPPACRTLTGAILEILGHDMLAAKILKTLKAATRFKIEISDNLLKNKDKWKIQ